MALHCTAQQKRGSIQIQCHYNTPKTTSTHTNMTRRRRRRRRRSFTLPPPPPLFSSHTASSVYLHVVDDVATGMRQPFVDSAGDDSALTLLQSLWELKMMQSGAVQGPIKVSSSPGRIPAPVHDLNVPYEGMEEYQTPTLEMLFPLTPMEMPAPTPFPVEPIQYQQSRAIKDENRTEVDDDANSKTGAPARYMQPPLSWTKQKPLDVDANVAYEETPEGGRISKTEQPIKDFYPWFSNKRKWEEQLPHLLNSNGNIPWMDRQTIS